MHIDTIDKRIYINLMEPAQPTVPENFYTLKQAAELLNVSAETLLEWNDNNILKPTITPNGIIGYKVEQINKFLEIQKLVQKKLFSHEQNTKQQLLNHREDSSARIPPQPNISKSTVDNETKISSNNTYKKEYPGRSHKFIGLGIMMTIILLGVLSLSVFTFGQRFLKTQPNHNSAFLEYTTNKNGLQDSNSSSIFVPLNSVVLSAKNSDTAIEASGEAKLVTSYAISETQTKDLTRLNKAFNINFGEIANFASKPSCPTCFKDMDTNVFDDKGNIRGDVSTKDLLATTIGTTGLIQSNKSEKQSANNVLLLTFLTLGLLSIVVAFRKSAYSEGINDTRLSVQTGPQSEPAVLKILELDQKTDGAVVLYFKGKEYKISKPELNSESDQFIERLMEYSYGNNKEVSYDIMKDDKINLNAPLSKLVTRLGFVGLKRDLFFPRTSKSRVLFRKYLTIEDLAAIGLTEDQISKELIN